MSPIANQLVIQFFNMIAFFRGYRFKIVTSEKEMADFETIYHEDGFSLPPQLQRMNARYKAGAISFIAYYRKTPIGTARLGNPKIKNRPFELFGLDEKGEHFEIQSLMVKKGFRDGAHFVMLGLFKAMYVYSVKHAIPSWISGSTRSVYLTIRRYNKRIQILEKQCKHINNPLTDYVYANDIVDIYYTMNVADFAPVLIFKKFIRHFMKQMNFVPALGFSKKNITT